MFPLSRNEFYFLTRARGVQHWFLRYIYKKNMKHFENKSSMLMVKLT